MTGAVFNIQRFCVQDGPGVRTAVFLKGCHLKCAWCHNPESHRRYPEIMYAPAECIYCGACAAVCVNHELMDGVHSFARAACEGCGRCAEVCYAGAIELCGKEMTAEEVMETVIRDRDFYGLDGGMTITGGEPLLQADFTLELAKLAKKSGINVCIETSGDGDSEILMEIARHTDLFLYDIKLLDGEMHKKHTGISNARILKNLRLLDEMGARTILRCPIIPDVNLAEEHFSGIAALAESLENVAEVQFEPYHPLGVSKSQRLGRESAYANPEFLPREKVEALARKVQPLTRVKLTVQ